MQRQQKKMYHSCDICIRSATDVLDVVHKYTSNVYDAYFGDNRVKSEERMRNSKDYQQIRLSLDIMLNDAKKLNFNKNLMVTQMLKDIEHIKGNLKLVIKHYNELRKQCEDAKYRELFSLSENQLYEIIIRMKKDMLKLIIKQSQSFQDMDKRFKSHLFPEFKGEVYMFCNKLINSQSICSDFAIIQNPATSMVQSESPVESVCFHFKKIYQDDRASMTKEKLEILLLL